MDNLEFQKLLDEHVKKIIEFIRKREKKDEK